MGPHGEAFERGISGVGKGLNRKIMKIAFDAQSLLEEEKTGIGWTIKMLVEGMIQDEDNEYSLNYFAFRNKKEKNERMSRYKSINTAVNCCGWMPLGVYHKIWNTIPVPYALLFPQEADVTIFFNYTVPPGVKGKTAVFIYDMVWKACPETMEESNRAFMDKNTRTACERADMIITISEFSRREIVKYMDIPEEKVKVVPCGVDLERFHPNYSPADVQKAKEKYGINGEYLLYLGTLEPRKNLMYLIESYAMLYAENRAVPDLVIAGKKGWQYDGLFQKVEECGLSSKVIFTGYVDEEDVPLLLKGARVFVFPSLYEGFGLPPLEAMACGTPVIVSNVSSLPEVVADAAILVDIEKKDALKDAIKTVCQEKSLQKELQDKGIKRASSFTWEKSTDVLKKICCIK